MRLATPATHALSRASQEPWRRPQSRTRRDGRVACRAVARSAGRASRSIALVAINQLITASSSAHGNSITSHLSDGSAILWREPRRHARCCCSRCRGTTSSQYCTLLPVHQRIKPVDPVAAGFIEGELDACYLAPRILPYHARLMRSKLTGAFPSRNLICLKTGKQCMSLMHGGGETPARPMSES